MSELMTGLSRSHMCCQIDENNIGSVVTVMGWVNKRRDLGKLIFIALRDRSGIIQVVIDGETAENSIFSKAESIRTEFVIAVKGTVQYRADGNFNPNMQTGKLEIAVLDLRILSEAQTPPFWVSENSNVKDDMRLKYRYLDLRRPDIQRNLILRHNVAQEARKFLNERGFLEIETPMLTKSTPEGARDYLVPSREYPGSFYALPQSPQLFKQMLMVSGLDRYYQIVRCFRDEDLRADRQPEFTQIDMELSFVEADDVMTLNEQLIKNIFKSCLNVEVKLPFVRFTYKEAMERFGSDKPDVRFSMELVNISDVVLDCDFKVFKNALDNGGSVRGINAKGCANFPRRQIDALVEFVRDYGAKGLVWIVISENGDIKSPAAKFFDTKKMNEIIEKMGGEKGDLLLISADTDTVVFDTLGALRVFLAKKLELTRDDDYSFLWVTDFPLLEWSEEDNRFAAKHHPFTAPLDCDLPLLDTNPKDVRAKAYDMVLNGVELGGGSIRIYNTEIQQKMFSLLCFTPEIANERFGFLLNAFKYGVPPHGGLAFGFDRMIMLMTGASSIRDVIAFPKVKDASCPLTDAPGDVDEKQLFELGLIIQSKEKEQES